MEKAEEKAGRGDRAIKKPNGEMVLERIFYIRRNDFDRKVKDGEVRKVRNIELANPYCVIKIQGDLDTLSKLEPLGSVTVKMTLEQTELPTE